MQNIDHLVYVVPKLEVGIQLIEQQFGVSPVYGGRHLNHGTHNAILSLGEKCYFEIIAIDSENRDVNAPRWMGVDLIQQPTLSRWAISPVDWSRYVQRMRKLNPKLGYTAVGNRQQADGKMLEWEMTLPLSEPAVEVLPFLLNWKGSVHPSQQLEAHCKLVNLEIEHPQPQTIKAQLQFLGANAQVKKANTPAIIATIQTPNGEVIIR